MKNAKKLTLSLVVSLSLAVSLSLSLLGAAVVRAEDPAPAPAKAAKSGAKEVTLKGTLGCGKCSFHEAKECENVLKVQDGDKVDTYVLADNAVSKANHEKVCGPSSPATVTGKVSPGKGKQAGRKVLTASSIKFD
jgi:hypothetical protein